MADSTALNLVAVAAIGGLVGTGELVARYRDAPWKALKCVAAFLYVAMNIAASLGAYGLVRAFGWEFGQEAGTEALRWTQVLIAGFGAMALFRSSLFLVRVGDQDVGVGPSSLLNVLLGAADREVDRERGRARARGVKELVQGVSWQRAREDLPALCLGLMQNATLEEQNALAGAIRDIESGDLDDDVRVHLVGLELLNFAGIGVLKGAVGLLSQSADRQPAESSSATEGQASDENSRLEPSGGAPAR